MEASSHLPAAAEIILDKSIKPRGRRSRLSLQDKETLLRLYARGEATTAIADRFGIDETYIRKLACRYRIRKGQFAGAAAPQPTTREKPRLGSHLAAYKRARRGFDVPKELEPRYVRLLIAGLSCRQAAKKLGLTEGAHEHA